MQELVKRVQRAGSASLASREHRHSWLRRRGTVGLFRCASCSASAVCPGCLQSLDVALLVDQGIAGLVLYWCPLHREELVRRSQGSGRVPQWR